MLILGIDPGVTVGWCAYDTVLSQAAASGNHGMTEEFSAMHLADHLATFACPVDAIVIERPVGQGPTRPTMVDCGIISGRLFELLRIHCEVYPVWMKRNEVRKALTDGIFGAWTVRNDATAWAALLELHGGPIAAKKGGRLYGVTKHAKAALATAVAYHLTAKKGNP